MTSPLQATRGSLVRLGPFWRAVKARLAGDAASVGIMNGGGVSLATDDLPALSLAKPQGRQVIVPSETLWPPVEQQPNRREVSWLVRSEFNDYPTGDQVQDALDALQERAGALLIGWTPTGLSGVLVVRPVWRQRPNEGSPRWDDDPDRQLHWMSSEFRAEVTRI